MRMPAMSAARGPKRGKICIPEYRQRYEMTGGANSAEDAQREMKRELAHPSVVSAGVVLRRCARIQDMHVHSPQGGPRIGQGGFEQFRPKAVRVFAAGTDGLLEILAVAFGKIGAVDKHANTTHQHRSE